MNNGSYKTYKPTEEELFKAHIYWLHLVKIYQDEEKMSDLFSVSVPNNQLWLSLARNGLLLSMEAVASKLNISRNAYSKIEKSEADGRVTVKTLRKAAEALDCELIYFIRPKNGKTFSFTTWSRLLEACFKTKRFKNYRAGQGAMPIAYQAFEILRSPKFRKENNLIKTWTI